MRQSWRFSRLVEDESLTPRTWAALTQHGRLLSEPFSQLIHGSRQVPIPQGQWGNAKKVLGQTYYTWCKNIIVLPPILFWHCSAQALFLTNLSKKQA